MDSDGERRPEEIRSDTRSVPRSLLGARLCPNLDDLDAKVALVGVPYDFGEKAAGSRFGPNALRDADMYLYAGRGGQGGDAAGYYDFEAGRQRLAGVTMADCGDIAVMAGDVERSFARVTRVARAMVARGSFPVAVGGDSSITAPLVRGYEAHASLDIVHFDAHHDFDDGAPGLPWSGGATIRRCAELPWVRHISHVGLRSMMSSREGFDAARSRGDRIIMADRFRELGPVAAMDLIPRSSATYLTIDVDSLDPSICPGTGSREPGGLTYLEMRDALRALARRGPIVGMDLVEVNPHIDPTGLTAKVAVRLIVDVLTARFDEGEPPATAESGTHAEA